MAVVEAETALFLGVAALFLCGVALFLRAADLLLGAALLLEAAALSLGALAFLPWRGNAPSPPPLQRALPFSGDDHEDDENDNRRA